MDYEGFFRQQLGERRRRRMTAMPADLHRVARAAFAAAIAHGMTQRKAFECALALVLQRMPQPDRAARRTVALMLATEPGLHPSGRETAMTEFIRLIELEIPSLRRYARALTRDTDRADELVQTCLLRALDKQHLWEPGSNLRAWLFTILHHARVNDLRRSVREEDRKEPAMSLMIAAPRQPDARLDLFDLDRAIAGLPEDQRRVLLLVCLEGIDYTQAAAILDLPLGTVRSRLARARTALRGALSRPAPRHRWPPAGIKAAAARHSERHLASA